MISLAQINLPQLAWLHRKMNHLSSSKKLKHIVFGLIHNLGVYNLFKKVLAGNSNIKNNLQIVLGDMEKNIGVV